MERKSSEGDSCNNNMDTEYQNAIKRKKTDGKKTEGEAVIEWLNENSKLNKSKTASTAIKIGNILRPFRPNE